MSAVAFEAPDRAGVLDAPARGASLTFLRERGMGASVLVTALSSGFGVALLALATYIGFLAQEYMGYGGTVGVMVTVLTVLFIIIAMYVAAIVTANTFATIVAGRTRQIALMRLIGSTARDERRKVANQGLVVGVIGSVIGLVVGVAVAYAGPAIAESVLSAPAYEDPVTLWMLLPIPAVILTTWVAAWGGSRRVLSVTPNEALGGAVARTHADQAGRRGRNGAAMTLGILGILLLTAGLVLGLYTPLAVLIAFVGGLLSFTALVMASAAIMPPILRLVGRAFGGSATARMAAQNALRYPERSSRMSIGVVVGVTLVVMLAVAAETFERILLVGVPPDEAEATGISGFIDMLSGVMMGLVGFAGVIAAVGLVNLLTIGVVQRRAELGLLRALGLSIGQIRRMVLLEAVHITLSSTLLGLALGVAYGWIGAQSTTGSVPEGGLLIAPAIPWIPVAIVVAAVAVLTIVASVAPTRLATRISPVEALAVE